MACIKFLAFAALVAVVFGSTGDHRAGVNYGDRNFGDNRRGLTDGSVTDSSKTDSPVGALGTAILNTHEQLQEAVNVAHDIKGAYEVAYRGARSFGSGWIDAYGAAGQGIARLAAGHKGQKKAQDIHYLVRKHYGIITGLDGVSGGRNVQGSKTSGSGDANLGDDDSKTQYPRPYIGFLASAVQGPAIPFFALFANRGKASTPGDAFDGYVALGFGCAEVLDKIIPGSGSLLKRGIIATYKIGLCLGKKKLGKISDKRSICDNNYGKDYDFEFAGKVSGFRKPSDYINKFGLKNGAKKFKKLVKSKIGTDVSHLKGASKFTANAVLSILKLFGSSKAKLSSKNLSDATIEIIRLVYLIAGQVHPDLPRQTLDEMIKFSSKIANNGLDVDFNSMDKEISSTEDKESFDWSTAVTNFYKVKGGKTSGDKQDGDDGGNADDSDNGNEDDGDNAGDDDNGKGDTKGSDSNDSSDSSTSQTEVSSSDDTDSTDTKSTSSKNSNNVSYKTEYVNGDDQNDGSNVSTTYTTRTTTRTGSTSEGSEQTSSDDEEETEEEN